MLATMMAPKAPQTAPDVNASMASAATETRCSNQRLHDSAHLRWVPRHREAALLHHGELGVGGIRAARTQRAPVAHTLARRRRPPADEADARPGLVRLATAHRR